MTETTEKKKADPRTVQLKRVRLSFTEALLEKKATVEDGTPKHNCNVILETSGKEFEDNKAKVIAALREAGDQQWGKPDAFKDIAEDNPKRVCFRKGERFKNKDGEIYKGYEGNWAFGAGGPGGGKHRPKMFDRHRRPVAEADILDVCYGGSYADVIVSFFGTDKGGRGIFCSVEAIRSHQEGDRVGGGLNVSADDFDEMPDGDAFDGTSAGAGADAGGDDFG